MNIEEYKNTITSLTELKYFLRQNNIALSKRYGQNFLYDKNIINNIVEILYIDNKVVLEIGPGLGNLTLFYYLKTQKNILVEIDRKLFQILDDLNLKNTEVVHMDFLKFDMENFIKKYKKISVVSNLPYNIATQVIAKLILYHKNIDKIYIMVPDILYKRMTAEIGTRQYSRISILIQVFYNVEKKFGIKRNSFFPVPEIDSVFLELKAHNKYAEYETFFNLFFDFVKIGFLHRRKKLRYIFNKYYADRIKNEIIKDYNDLRIEELSIDDIFNIVVSIQQD